MDNAEDWGMPDQKTTAGRRAAPLLVCLLRARAATLAGQGLRSSAWALVGLVAVLWWQGLGRMIWAMEATDAG